MEKGNGKTIAVVSLVVAVFALAVGFATFSANLTIDNGAATVVPGDTFTPNIKWKATSAPTCTVTTNTSTRAAVTSSGSYSGNTSWTGIDVKLGAPGDVITCTGTVENTSTFIAYLRSITSSGNNNGKLQCAASSTDVDNISPATNAADVCPYIQLEVKAADTAATNTTITSTTAGNNTFSGAQALTVPATNGTQEITLTLTYLSANAVLANGAITVTIPTITLNYKTDNTSA